MKFVFFKLKKLKKFVKYNHKKADVLSSCSHRNIIQFYGAVSNETNYCIVTGKLFNNNYLKTLK